MRDSSMFYFNISINSLALGARRGVTSSCWCKKSEGVAQQFIARAPSSARTRIARGLQVQPAPAQFLRDNFDPARNPDPSKRNQAPLVKRRIIPE